MNDDRDWAAQDVARVVARSRDLRGQLAEHVAHADVNCALLRRATVANRIDLKRLASRSIERCALSLSAR